MIELVLGGLVTVAGGVLIAAAVLSAGYLAFSTLKRLDSLEDRVMDLENEE